MNMGKINKTTKKDFKEATKLPNIWNKIIEWNGLKLATVMFHEDRVWKIVDKHTNFETISDRKYKPIREFRTQEDMWKYIKYRMV